MVNRKLFFVMLFIFAVGLCSGSFFEAYMQGEGKEQLKELISVFFSSEESPAFAVAFLSSVKKWLLLSAVLFICPLLPLLMPAVPLIPLFKGLALGFSATILVETFGIKASLYILGTLVPQNIIQIPVLCFAAAVSLETSVLVIRQLQPRRRRSNKKALQNYARQYILTFGAVIILVIFSCLLEAFLMKVLL